MELHQQIFFKCIRSRTMVSYLIAQSALFVLALKSVPMDIATGSDHALLAQTWMQIYKVMANDIEFLFVYIPFFLLFILKAFSYYNKINILLKFESIRVWWQRNVRLNIYFSLLFTGILHVFAFPHSFYNERSPFDFYSVVHSFFSHVRHFTVFRFFHHRVNRHGHCYYGPAELLGTFSSDDIAYFNQGSEISYESILVYI
ncbi:hypothetical protein [Paenibacillus caui]|uniref:hypothetical protein n=1 Tax=Paenibacillus caui TaxID=2873927 RepID=UPI001CA89166|nr:hypothetical protein [Paenibacillus caui]